MATIRAGQRAGCPFHFASRAQTAAEGVRTAPGPRGWRLLANLLEIRRDRLLFVERAVREHGDAVAFPMGGKRLFLFAHPEHFRRVLVENPEGYRKGVGLAEARCFLGDGLLTSEGEVADRERHRLLPAFRRERVEAGGGAIAAAAQEMLGRWDRLEEGERTLDVSREMVLLTLEALGRTLFASDLRPVARQLADDLDLVGRWAIRRMTALVPLPLWLPTRGNRRARRARARLDAVAERLLRERRERGGLDAEDVLAQLLKPGGEGERQVRDEVVTLLLAGHETAAATLTWAWHLLALHPEAEARLHQELAEVLGGRPPTVDDLPRLAWTQAVVDEVLRLYPPVWMIPRRAVADDVVHGWAVPAGSDVLLSVCSLHRHPELWTRPESFAPDRFEGARMAPFGFLPFGAGPRACLGGRFAVTEVCLVLAAVAQRYRLAAVPGRVTTAEALLTLHPRGGLPLRLQPRNSPTRGDVPCPSLCTVP